MYNFGNFCEFSEIFTETHEQNIRKLQKIWFFFMENMTNKVK